MSGRVIAFVAVTVVCAVVAVTATAMSISRQQEATAAAPAATAATGDRLATARTQGQAVLVFRDLDRKHYGRFAFAPLIDGAPGARRRTGLTCDRVSFAASTGICVTRTPALLNESTVTLLDGDLRVRARLKVAGAPSRASLSTDGKLASVTTFVTGHSYATPGEFSTATTLIDVTRGTEITNLEQFATLDREGRRVTARDLNYWGVTFASDDRTFYATVAFGGATHLIRGDLNARRARIIHDNVECPSISPDGTRLGYKKLVASDSGSPRIWRFTVLDLSTMRETPLAERAPRDDQIAWLDDDHVLYGNGEETWTVPADGSGAPRRYLAAGHSPAVVR